MGYFPALRERGRKCSRGSFPGGYLELLLACPSPGQTGSLTENCLRAGLSPLSAPHPDLEAKLRAGPLARSRYMGSSSRGAPAQPWVRWMWGIGGSGLGEFPGLSE